MQFSRYWLWRAKFIDLLIFTTSNWAGVLEQRSQDGKNQEGRERKRGEKRNNSIWSFMLFVRRSVPCEFDAVCFIDQLYPFPYSQPRLIESIIVHFIPILRNFEGTQSLQLRHWRLVQPGGGDLSPIKRQESSQKRLYARVTCFVILRIRQAWFREGTECGFRPSLAQLFSLPLHLLPCHAYFHFHWSFLGHPSAHHAASAVFHVDAEKAACDCALYLIRLRTGEDQNNSFRTLVPLLRILLPLLPKIHLCSKMLFWKTRKMRLSHASLLLTGVTTAFAQHMPRYLDQFVERDEPFQAPRQDSPVPVQYIDHPCEYNSDYDSTILPQERINAESISTQPIVIKVRTFVSVLYRKLLLISNKSASW